MTKHFTLFPSVASVYQTLSIPYFRICNMFSITHLGSRHREMSNLALNNCMRKSDLHRLLFNNYFPLLKILLNILHFCCFSLDFWNNKIQLIYSLMLSPLKNTIISLSFLTVVSPLTIWRL